MLKTRRQFVRDLSLASAALSWLPRPGFGAGPGAPIAEPVSFFFVSDTHYCADAEDFSKMDDVSAGYNARLVDWLNKLPGTAFSQEIGGGVVPQPLGVVHGGDLVDNGDKGAAKAKMVDTELAAFTADYGLNGGDGRLRWPVREVHGNHDSPRLENTVIKAIKARNQRRNGLANVSENGLHYSWDWGGVHFVALGIVVGDAPEVTRQRRYAPHGSLPFLRRDLAEKVGTSGRPVVLIHHVDVHRYSAEVADEVALRNEWDFGDTHAFYETVKPYRIAATLCGHTHVRKIARWNGTKDDKTPEGVPFINTDNAGHFGSAAQAFLHLTLQGNELRIREFATKDGWQTGAWTPQVWTFPV